MTLTKPIVLIGPPRSGTTALADVLSCHPEIAYWVEPRYIWLYKTPTPDLDERSATDATSNIRQYIRERFERYRRREGGTRFMEKTPSNCLRSEFVANVLDDAQFIVLSRNGEDTVRSIYRRWTGRRDWRAIGRRISSFDVPIGDIHRLIVSRLKTDKERTWGPRFTGIDEVKKRNNLDVTCAIQWSRCMSGVRNLAESVGPGSIVYVSYETLIENPVEEVRRILDTVGLSRSGYVDSAATSLTRTGGGERVNLSDSAIRIISEAEKLPDNVT